MGKSISYRVEKLELSGIRRFYNKVLKEKDAISLTLGQPDFSVPERVKSAMIRAIDDNKTVYTENAGIADLRKEISGYLKYQKIQFDADEICITIGGSEALFSTFMTILNPGDKVLIPDPSYPAYESCVKLAHGNVIKYKLDNDFRIDVNQIEDMIIREKPKALVLSFPSNPTGAVLTEEICNSLYNILKAHDIYIVTDEIYSSLCYERNYSSIAVYSELKDKIIYINGFSKMFSMTGLRIGYICASRNFINQMIKVHQYNVSCAPSISQYGALEGIKYCLQDVENMKNEFKKRRDYVYNRLVHIGFETNLPGGAFYIFPSIKKFGLDSETFCERMLKEAKVAVVPGNAFGESGEGHIRISYSYSFENLEYALDRIEEWISGLKL